MVAVGAEKAAIVTATSPERRLASIRRLIIPEGSLFVLTHM